ncbi:hypothetical protein [Pseudomonas baltica]|uniref:hypothetical protein n=1 Tax=Pseudomonas baltica TaxID=2762576 RepID=UPI00289BC37D|nr:hypothetical protein [Pseudomonas baltica]
MTSYAGQSVQAHSDFICNELLPNLVAYADGRAAPAEVVVMATLLSRYPSHADPQHDLRRCYAYHHGWPDHASDRLCDSSWLEVADGQNAPHAWR